MNKRAPIINEDRTVIIKDHSLKTYTWTGKTSTWQKHKNVVKPKLNTVILTGYCSHLAKSCPLYMGADDYCLVSQTHKSFWKCWKPKFLDQKKKIIHGQRISGGMRADGKLGITWLLLSKDTLKSLCQGKVAFSFLSFLEMNLGIFWWALFAVEASVSLVCYHRLPLQSVKTGTFKGHCFWPILDVYFSLRWITLQRWEAEKTEMPTL